MGLTRWRWFAARFACGSRRSPAPLEYNLRSSARRRARPRFAGCRGSTFATTPKAYADLMMLPRTRVVEMRPLMHVEGWEPPRAGAGDGQGVMVVSCHMGSYEVTAAIGRRHWRRSRSSPRIWSRARCSSGTATPERGLASASCARPGRPAQGDPGAAGQRARDHGDRPRHHRNRPGDAVLRPACAIPNGPDHACPADGDAASAVCSTGCPTTPTRWRAPADHRREDGDDERTSCASPSSCCARSRSSFAAIRAVARPAPDLGGRA